MKIIAITKKGAELGEKIVKKFENTNLFLPEKLQQNFDHNHKITYFNRLDDVIFEAFQEKEPLIFIMSTGIVTRLL